jgi:hypothetical protein
MDDSELAALQAALVTALARASSPEEVLSVIAEVPLSEPLRRWITASDPRAIETALELVRRWTEPL